MDKAQQTPWYYDTTTVNNIESDLKNHISAYIGSHNLSIEDEILNDIVSNVYSGKEFNTPSPVKPPSVCPHAPQKARRVLKFKI